jgi:WD40 repeat protein
LTLDNHRQMSYHTDYVRDAMIISTDSFSLFVSGGLDKFVHLWDLESLQYKATRSGFDAGTHLKTKY